jgi:hypothetical protein
MLKAIVTVIDENNNVRYANMLINEYNSIPVAFGMEHEFRFKVTTADEDFMRNLYKSCSIKEELDEVKNEQR